MKIRSLWQLLLAIVVFACAQHYLQDPSAFFTFDTLIVMRIWLLWIVILTAALFGVEKLGERGRALAQILMIDDNAHSSPQKRSWIWLVAGLIFVVCFLIKLEHDRPFFFTQDDNLMQFLPVIVQGGRSAIDGIFPTWNPYQYLGAPTTSLGVYALTYPITYICYLFSRFILHNEFLTVEVFCIFHIIVGYFASYWAARCYRIRPALAALVGLCTALSGWALSTGGAWYYSTPIFLYVPLLIVGVTKLEKGSGGWKWIAGMTTVIALFFHAGNVQFWVYGMMFLWMALGILKLTGQIHWNKLLSALAASLLGTSLTLPLLVPQFIQTRDVIRIMPQSFCEIVGNLQAFLLPAEWLKPAAAIDTIPDLKSGGLVFYSGTTFMLCFGLLAVCTVFYRLKGKALTSNIWFPSAGVAFLASFGGGGIIWPIMLRLPLFSKFRVPIKFLAFFDIFAILTGAMVLERLLRRTRWNKQWTVAVVVITSILVAATCTMQFPRGYPYSIQPYPSADKMLDQISDARNHTQRIASLGMLRSPGPGYWQEMPHNLPTVYQVPALLGYDPLVELTPSFLKVNEDLKTRLLSSLQEYGIRYVLLPNDFEHPRVSGVPLAGPTENYSPLPRSEVHKMLPETKVLFHDDELSILRVSESKPLAFAENAPFVPLPLQLRANGLDVDVTLTSQGGRVIANFLWYPEMRAEVDGQTVKTTADSWQRIAIDLPSGARKVQIRFVPEWGKGFLCAVLAALMGIACRFLALRANSSEVAARQASQ